MRRGTVVSVSADSDHRFSKQTAPEIRIIAGLGVEGDAHAGEKVQHRSRVRVDASQPNLRQVHLIHSELFEELRGFGYAISPGDLGENITTGGLNLLELGRDTLLRIGPDVVLSVTGLRNPCAQIDSFAPGLLKHVAVKTERGLVRKSGIMTVALTSGIVSPGDTIIAEPPEGAHIPLERV